MKHALTWLRPPCLLRLLPWDRRNTSSVACELLQGI